MEVAIACGREAQLTAVDDILGKSALQAKAAAAAEAGAADNMDTDINLASSDDDDDHGGSGGGARANGAAKRRRSSSRGPSATPDGADEDQMSVDTERLLGSTAGAADTASSRLRRHRSSSAPSSPAPAPAPAAAAQPVVPDAERMRHLRIRHMRLFEVAQDIYGEAEDAGAPMNWADALEEAIVELEYDDAGLDRQELVALMQEEEEDDMEGGMIMGMWAPRPQRVQPLRDSPPPRDVAEHVEMQLRQARARGALGLGGAAGAGGVDAGRQGTGEQLEDVALRGLGEWWACAASLG